MARIYFDVTDIIHYASRYSRLTGIQRVQLCITGLLARAHGGDVIRCVFYDAVKRQMLEFDPAARPVESEFDAESLLIQLGLSRPSTVFPSKVQVKSYLRRYNNSKLLRTFRKLDIYVSALLARPRLRRFGLTVAESTAAQYGSIAVSTLAALPAHSCYACLGSVWLHPEVVRFAQEHHAHGGRVVQMVYDLIPISHPDNYTRKEAAAYAEWLTRAFEYTTRFISISQWTATALDQFANRAGRKVAIQVTTLAHEFTGYERNSRQSVPAGLGFLADRKFVLCVGTIEHRKNGITLLRAWQSLLDELGEQVPVLVFAGKYGKGGAEFQQYLEQCPALLRYVHVEHAPSDHALAWLYGNCLFTALPSLIEGWGLPVGESAWFGKFCVASSATSIPEVCGALMDYVDPNDVESIRAGLRKPIVEPAYLQQREQEILHAPLKRWMDVADEIYQCVAATPTTVLSVEGAMTVGS